MKPKNDPLKEKTMRFAIRIVRLSKYLTEVQKEFVISRQILRSGTNPGAMVREAANAESGRDFIHKLSVAQKETSETLYWLELLYHAAYLSKPQYESIINDGMEIMKILRSSILTKKQRMNDEL
ncbi:MAG: four helix bundle protein [Saprospiraceae bacterium]|nr:four helix bundle protein [Saprospiraceae bacterium]